MLDWLEITGIGCGIFVVILFRFALRNSVRQTVAEEMEQWRKNARFDAEESQVRPLSFTSSRHELALELMCNRDLYR
ncbi:hypothetical protein [Herbaspirillum rubrisubalbicans]|uniref:Uncharacterized protein n=1 Tax=Herbaspirillum rubrisubalbicans TaxID=80842 RepID=A0AAD0XHL3_9BURK|nr:hypothetical protein [Herbaspirillum rubrisubalbicans]AYR24665.1 hypothetical protein RC54_12880 [Herbaspirillum rubrisubalbicans]